MYTNASRAVLLLISSVMLFALAPPGAIGKEDGFRSETTEARRGLIDFVQFFSNRIERASSEISRGTDDMRIKQHTVYFKLRAIPLARRALELVDDQAVMMSLWLYSEMIVRFMDTPAGKDYFGKGAPIMAEAGAQLVSTASGMARELLSPKQFEAARDGIAKFLEGRNVTWSVMAERSSHTEWSEVVTSSLDKPMDVVSASIGAITFGGGLSDTAVAVHHAAGEAERAIALIGYLPTDIRWQSELLLLELSEYLDLDSVVESAGKIGDSSASIAETARTLPRDVRVEVTALLDEVEARRTSLESTLSAVNTTLASADQAAQTLTGTLGALDAAMLTILGPPEERGGASNEDEEPFDIDDYTQTAVEVAEAAAALQALVIELKGMDGAPATSTLIERAEAMAGGIVTRLYVGAGLLVLFTALVVLAYRAAIVRLGLQQGRTAD